MTDAEWLQYKAEFSASKMIYPGDWLWFKDAADFKAFWGGGQPLPETCIGLQDSACRAWLETCQETLECGRKPLDEPGGFYYHRTRHVARCGDCQESEWIAQGFEVENGFPYGDWSLGTAERIAEQNKKAAEELARLEKRRQDRLIAEAKALFNATEVSA